MKGIRSGELKAGTVICLERKQQGEDLGMSDVIVLAKIIEHNKMHPDGGLNIPKEVRESLIYKDAELYNIANAKGIQVIGVEGKKLSSVKESPTRC